jgi:hypothetical protein
LDTVKDPVEVDGVVCQLRDRAAVRRSQGRSSLGREWKRDLREVSRRVASLKAVGKALRVVNRNHLSSILGYLRWLKVR